MARASKTKNISTEAGLNDKKTFYFGNLKMFILSKSGACPAFVWPGAYLKVEPLKSPSQK
jgi:hypothetical protein